MTRSPLEVLRDAEFRKSSFSDPNQDCVEIARTPDAFGVRDSKLTDSPVIAVGVAEGRAFIRDLRAGHIAE